MKRSVLSIPVLVLVSLLLFSTHVFALSFSMVNVGSDDVSDIQVSLLNIVGGVEGTVDVSGGPIVADITGVFFDLNPFITLTSVEYVSSSPATLPSSSALSFTAAENNVSMAPNNSNMGGSIPKFDVGVAIGETGLTDDFQTIVFNVFGTGIDVTDFTRMGVRLQSVGILSDDPENDREGSAKYVGSPVPIPAAIYLLGAGFVGLLGIRRKSNR